MSLRLLPVLESRYCQQPPSAPPPPSSLSAVVGSHLADTYRQVQLSLSTRLAAAFSPLSDQLTIEACRRVAAMRGADGRQQLLNCLPPWLRNIRLTRPAPVAPAMPGVDDGYLLDEQWLTDSEAWEGRTTEQRAAAKRADSDALRAARPTLFRHACYPTQATQQSILTALLELTHAMHASQATRTVELVWLSLAAVRDNVAAIVQLLLAGMERRQTEPDFHAETLSTHKRVALFCSRANPLATVGKLVHTIYKGRDTAPPAAAAAATEDRRSRRGSRREARTAGSQPLRFAVAGGGGVRDRLLRLRPAASAPQTVPAEQSVVVRPVVPRRSVRLGRARLHRVRPRWTHCPVLLSHWRAGPPPQPAFHPPPLGHTAHQHRAQHSVQPAAPYGPDAVSSPSRQSDVSFELEQQRSTEQTEQSLSPPAGSRSQSIAARTSAYSTLTAAFSSSRSRLSSAPSAGLSLAIAESQQLRVLGVRQRRALLLMNSLNSHGRPQPAHQSQQRQSHREQAADVLLSDVVHTLLRVVADSSSRPSLSRRWWHHAVQWSVGSASSLSSSQSHLVYRALSPPLLLSHYWKCIAALDCRVALWRECAGGSGGSGSSSEGLVHLLLTLQQLVGCLEVSRSDGVSLSQRQSTSASSALRCELLPSLLWSCVDVLHRAFGSPALRSDSSLLVCCIRVIGACLSCARDDRHFEHSVYEWKRRKQSQQVADDDELLFVGIQPLLMRCLLPADISVYSSFPTLNMLSTSAVQLAQPAAPPQLDQQQQSARTAPPPPPSPALVSAVFSFLGSFTPLPSSPLAPLLDISSFAQRALASLIAQLPLILQRIDEAREAHPELVPSSCGSSSLPCSHQPPYLSVSSSGELVSSCQGPVESVLFARPAGPGPRVRVRLCRPLRLLGRLRAVAERAAAGCAARNCRTGRLPAVAGCDGPHGRVRAARAALAPAVPA